MAGATGLSWPGRSSVRAVAFHGGVAEFVDQVLNTRTGEVFEVVAAPHGPWRLSYEVVSVSSESCRDGEGQMTLRRLDDGTTFVVHLRQP
jgi:hypothetical protein